MLDAIGSVFFSVLSLQRGAREAIHGPVSPSVAPRGASLTPTTLPPARTIRFSLRIKWAAAILIAALVPLVVVAARGLSVQRSGLVRVENELELAATSLSRRGIDEALAENGRLAADVAAILANGDLTDAAAFSLVQGAVKRNTVVSDLAVYDPEGNFRLAAVGTVAGATARKPPQKLPELVDGGAALLRDGDSLRLIEPERVGDELVGFVVSWIPIRVFDERLDEISRRHLGAAGRISILDASLQPLAGGLPLADAKSLVKSIDRGGDAGKKVSFELSGTFRTQSGAQWVGTVVQDPARALVFCTGRPEAEAFAELGATRRAFFFASGGALLLALILGTVLARRTTEPIASLVRLVNRYRKREFSAASTVRTGDELEDLGDALTRMAQGIADGEAELRRQEAVRNDLSRFLPEALATRIAAGEAEMALGGRRKIVAVLFADVVAFTPFAEKAAPEDVSAFLNELFGILSEVVFRHDGVVDKFLGDCIMAVFGAMDEADPAEAARRAVAASEDMHRFVAASAPSWQDRFGFDVRVGIGVALGDAVVGNLGSERRMEFTAVGDAVNVAARLETLARPGQTLVTHAVATQADEFVFRSLGERALRGKSAPVEIFELVVDE